MQAPAHQVMPSPLPPAHALAGVWGGAELSAPASPRGRELERELTLQRQELARLRRSLQLKCEQLRSVEQVLCAAQSDLELAGRMAQLGQMAKGVIHELSQPLSEMRTLAGNAAACLRDGQADKAQRNLARLDGAGQRMGDALARLKTLTRHGSDATGPLDLCACVRASAQLLQSDFRQGDVRLLLQLGDGPVRAWGHGARVAQVLLCLLRNALDAVREAPQRQVRVAVRQDGGWALVCVRDSGAGLSEEARARLFEPFFTTKPWGQALGLGLSIALGVAQAMRGTLQGGNHAQGGAEFCLRLPLQPP